MKKTFKIFVAMALVVMWLPASAAFGQFIANAPFKPQYPNAPDFTVKDLDGKTFRLSALKGKPVLIFFGTTWCPACRTEIPRYNRVHETYAPKGLETVYVNIMESAEKVRRFARAQSISARVLLDLDGKVGELYNVVGVPMMVLIDAEGRIIKVSHSSSDLPLEQIFESAKP